MRKFKDLEVWQLGMEIVEYVYQVSKELPLEEQYGLKSQITRAAVSVPSNIAEGSAKSSTKEFKYYLERALGSLYELETQLLLISKLGLSNSVDEKLLDKVDHEQRMLGSLITRIRYNN